MHKTKCSKETKDKIIKIHEAKSSAIYINNEDQDDFFLIHHDGCVVINKSGADFILLKSDLKSLAIIELKGISVKDAYNQIVETTKYVNSTNLSTAKKTAIIVNRFWPKATVSLQTLQQRYAKDFKSKLLAARHLSTKKYKEII
jgi:hypothetical protein